MKEYEIIEISEMSDEEIEILLNGDEIINLIESPAPIITDMPTDMPPIL